MRKPANGSCGQSQKALTAEDIWRNDGPNDPTSVITDPGNSFHICNILYMNFTVYLPDDLKRRFDSYVNNKGLTTNAAIRKAVETFY